MKKIDENGFGVIEVSLVLIVLLLAIGIGSYIIKSGDKKSEKPAAISKVDTAQDTESKSTAETNKAPTKKYLELTKAKLKLELSDAIGDAYYVSNDEDSSGYSIGFSTRTLDALGIPACTATIGSLKDGTTGAATLGFDICTGVKSGFKNNPNAIRIGNDWFEISASTACSSSNSATQAKIQSIQNAFVSATKTLTRI